MCILAIGLNKDDFFFFGDSFLRSYYQIYDEENSLIGLTPHLYSSVSTIELASEQPSMIQIGFFNEVLYKTLGNLSNFTSLFLIGFTTIFSGQVVYQVKKGWPYENNSLLLKAIVESIVENALKLWDFMYNIFV